MKSIVKTLTIATASVLFSSALVQAEVADPVYRDGAFNTYINHAGLSYRYDNETAKWKVIHSAGGGNYAPNSVRVTDSWAEFLNGYTLTGWKCPANLSKGVRDSIVSDALDQLNAHYWSLSIFTACYKRPNTSPGNGDGRAGVNLLL